MVLQTGTQTTATLWPSSPPAPHGKGTSSLAFQCKKQGQAKVQGPGRTGTPPFWGSRMHPVSDGTITHPAERGCWHMGLQGHTETCQAKTEGTRFAEASPEQHVSHQNRRQDLSSTTDSAPALHRPAPPCSTPTPTPAGHPAAPLLAPPYLG